MEGGTFTIEVVNNSDKHPYIKSVSLNGKPYTLPYITHEEIVKGGLLVIEMSSEL